MTEPLSCWQCGASLEGVRQPFDRLAECPACAAELHVCRICAHYDPHAPQACREERAEPPRLKDRANFCDWLQPRPQAHRTADAAAESLAQAQLDALFGQAKPAAGAATGNPLDELFDLPAKRGPGGGL